MYIHIHVCVYIYNIHVCIYIYVYIHYYIISCPHLPTLDPHPSGCRAASWHFPRVGSWRKGHPSPSHPHFAQTLATSHGASGMKVHECPHPTAKSMFHKFQTHQLTCPLVNHGEMSPFIDDFSTQRSKSAIAGFPASHL